MNWGYKLATAMGVFMAFIIGIAIYLSGEPVDMVTDQYYQKSLDHDKKTLAQNNANGVAEQITISCAGKVCKIKWPEMLKGKQGNIYFYRPSDKQKDFTTSIEFGTSEQFVENIKLVAGLWRLQFTWQDEKKQACYAEKEVWAQP